MSNTSAKSKDKHKIVDAVVEDQQRAVRKAVFYILIGLKLLAVLIVIFGVLFFINSRKPVAQTSPVSIEITRGEGVKQIAKKLKEAGAIKSERSFLWKAFIKRDALQAGIYRIEAGESVASIYQKIASGEVYEDKITIPEGWRREQIAQLLTNKFNIDYESFMAVTEGKEGKLFPDTYRVPKNATAEFVSNVMQKNFTQKTSSLTITDDQLKIASIVEREAKKDEDRPKIARVFLNRVEKGMKMEADPTVQYALDNDRLEAVTTETIKDFKFWQPVKAGEPKSTISDYNLYLKFGLGPTPICNPGLKSIQAVLSPAKSDDLYFYTGADGSTYFAKTLAEHNENIQKYSGN